MRSGKEIAHRLRQELLNLGLFLFPPRAALEAKAPLPGLPDPCAATVYARGNPYASKLEALAEDILAHRFPLLGREAKLGPEIHWRKDYQRGIESRAWYFRLIPALDARRVGDQKQIWELNRHQHLVLLAQAWRCTGKRRFLDEIAGQLRSWWKANPYQCGINWSSALEVAFRALSWIWVFHLAGESFDDATRRRLLAELYRHGCHLEANLSYYSSPNTHLLGEAVVLHALGTLLPEFPRAQHWRETGSRVVCAQMDTQVREDGSHFEQSTYYHLYALDFFLFHALLAPAPASYLRKLERMGEYLQALLGPSRRLPLLGDDDGGRVFHPYGDRAGFGRATLASCAILFGRHEWGNAEDAYEQAVWWLGGERAAQGWKEPTTTQGVSRLFPDSGLAIMAAGPLQAIVDAGPFGAGNGGHSHSDGLSVVLSHGDEEILIDPGTYTYMADPAWREWFRGSQAHNTIRVDEREQAVPMGPFRWRETPMCKIGAWVSEAEMDYLDGCCGYAGVEHRRRVLLWKKPRRILILDELTGPDGLHTVEAFWHLGQPVLEASPGCVRIGACATLAVAGSPALEQSSSIESSWRSRAFGVKEPAPVMRLRRRGRLPVVMGTAIDMSGQMTDLVLSENWDGRHFRGLGGELWDVVFPRDGNPRILPAEPDACGEGERRG